MNMLIVGASKGLGRAFVEGLPDAGDTVIGISRTAPVDLQLPAAVASEWIEADMSKPAEAVAAIERQLPAALDVLIYNLGIWEEQAFTDDYRFLDSSDAEISALIQTNVVSAILLLKRLIPRLLESPRPQVVLVGSTSALPQSGQPEVAFGASKFALRGIADALREGFRDSRLAVTCLQLGDLNTDDPLATPLAEASRRGEGELIPVHDVVKVTRSLLSLSASSYVREITLPAIADERF